MHRFRAIGYLIFLFCGSCHGAVLETTTMFNEDEISDMITTEFPMVTYYNSSESVQTDATASPVSSTTMVTVQSSTTGSTSPSTSTSTTPRTSTSTSPSTSSTTSPRTEFQSFTRSPKPSADTFINVAETLFTLGNPKNIENSVNTGERRSVTPEDLSDDLLNWEPPKYIRDEFPMYLSGFDFDDQPIWICEMGKYDLHSVLRRGPAAQKDLEKFVARVTKIMLSSNSWKNPQGYKGSFILDFDGLKFKHYAQVESLAFLLKLGHAYRGILEDHVEYVDIVNANYPAHALIDLWRPVIGRIMEVVEIYGNDRSKWIPQLLRHYPKESLPEWYGGYKNFTPYKVL